MNPPNKNPYSKNTGNFIEYEVCSTAAASPLLQTASHPLSYASQVSAPALKEEPLYTLEYDVECCPPQ